MTSIDPRIGVLEEELARRRAELGATLEAVPQESRGLIPEGGAWSVAMVLEHLSQTERSVTRLLGKLAADAPLRPAEDYSPAAFLDHIDLPAFLDRSRKLRGSQPSGALPAEDAWRALEESRRGLLAALRQLAGLRLEDVSFDHPVGMSLDGYRWIAFVALHEARHAAQIREILERLRDAR